jgi:hypothetical protein
VKKFTTTLPAFLTDVSIVPASLPAVLGGATTHGVLWQAAPGSFLLDVPAVARYLVVAGKTINIDFASEAIATEVERHMLMLPLAALLYQRGMLAVHAAAVANDQGVVLLAGDSGSGKSTLLPGLLKRGWTMLADELAIVGLNELGQPVVYPTASVIALWPESLEKLGIDITSLPSADVNRLELAASGQAVVGSLPLRTIYRLGVHGAGEIELKELTGSARFRAVGTLLYNSHVADAVCSRPDYLRCAAAIAQSVPISILRRPRGIWSVEALTELITINHQGNL